MKFQEACSQILNSCQTLIDNTISKASYDRTEICKIKALTDKKNIYKIEIRDTEYSAKGTGEYAVGDTVKATFLKNSSSKIVLEDKSLEVHKDSDDHDGRYYTEDEIATLLATHKTSSDHDERYYTESEIATLFTAIKPCTDYYKSNEDYSEFVQYPASWLHKEYGFTVSSVSMPSGSNTTYCPSSYTGPQWWNVLTFGATNRTTQIAYQGFHNRTYGHIFMRLQHDVTVEGWRCITSTTETKVISSSGAISATGITDIYITDSSLANKDIKSVVLYRAWPASTWTGAIVRLQEYVYTSSSGQFQLRLNAQAAQTYTLSFYVTYNTL